MNSADRHLYILILSLFLIGAATFSYRHWVLNVPLTDTETVNSWTVEATLRFTADARKPIKAHFFIPYMPPGFAIIDEYFVSHNYGVTTNLVGENRQTVWSQRRASGAQSLYYRAIFRETEHRESALGKPAAIKAAPLTETQQPAVDSILQEVRQSSADIQTFAQAAITLLNKRGDNAKLLVDGHFSHENIIKSAILVLNKAKIAAMAVKGIQLSGPSATNEFKSFLAVYNGTNWIFINPETASAGLPKRFLLWQYGEEPTFNVSGGKKPSFGISVSATPVNALALAKERGERANSQLLRFSMLQLPVNVQETYKILLTVPIGAFIILLLRNFIGLKTFGTFMPVLIALAFRETNVSFGVFLFTIIVSFGLIVRFYLDHLHLLLVPRLAAILTVVILVMIFLSILTQNLGIDTGLSVALFPMVILTMTIERMCITWDERGATEAIQCGIGSLIAAIIAFSVMNQRPLQYLLFAFPEILFMLLAIILLFGQYRGYRLFELMRFKALAGD
ncbi:MAG: inactive transglutaminase family protein [Legionellaceae bacterium]|nr:inactive transglutaminase family protein [Legionellaceae bacterium]